MSSPMRHRAEDFPQFAFFGSMEPIGGAVQTTDATVTTIWTGRALATDEQCDIIALISGFSANEAQALWYGIAGQVWDDGGVVNVNTPVLFFEVESTAAPTVTINATGSQPRIRVTGTAGATYGWRIEFGLVVYRKNA